MQGRFTVPLPTKRACVVCDQALTPHITPTRRGGADAGSAEVYAVCLELACRAVFQRAEARSRSDVEFARALQRDAQAWRELKARHAVEARQRKARWAAEARQNVAVFETIAEQPGEVRVVVPSGHAPVRRLPQRRRRVHAVFLDAIIADAFRLGPLEFAASDSDAGGTESSLPGRLCGACGGGCCAGGGTHAFLSSTDIRRVMAANPGLDAAGVRGAYFDRLPERTVSNACVYLQRNGCSLPKAMRGDICNAYLCGALWSLTKGLAADPPVRRVVVLRRRQKLWNQDKLSANNDIVAGATLTETSSRRLRPPPGGWPSERVETPAP